MSCSCTRHQRTFVRAFPHHNTHQQLKTWAYAFGDVRLPESSFVRACPCRIYSSSTPDPCACPASSPDLQSREPNSDSTCSGNTPSVTMQRLPTSQKSTIRPGLSCISCVMTSSSNWRTVFVQNLHHTQTCKARNRKHRTDELLHLPRQNAFRHQTSEIPPLHLERPVVFGQVCTSATTV